MPHPRGELARRGRTLTGTCLGSGGREYGVQLRFERAGDARTLMWAACDCPVGSVCKHAVALLLTAAATPQHPPSERWRSVFTRMLSDLSCAAGDGGVPIGLEFSLRPPTTYRPVEVVGLRPVSLGKRGTWVKRGLNWRRLLFNPDPGEFDRGQYLAVRALAIEVERSCPMVGDALMVAGTRAAFWSLLTGAADAGTALIADRSGGVQAVEVFKNAQLRLEFAADDAGGAAMSTTLFVDGERCDTDGVGLFGMPTADGMHHVVDGVLRLGPFDPAPAPTMLSLVARNERVHIPAEQTQEFALTTLGRLAALAEDAVWGRVLPGLRAVAATSRNWKYQAAQHVSRGMYHTLDAAMIRELRAIGEASDSAGATRAASVSTLRAPVDFTIAETAVLCGETLPQLDCRDVVAIEIDPGVRDFRAAGGAPRLEFSRADGDPVGNDWFDLDITFRVAEHAVPLRDVITELSMGATHMVLPSGVYFPLQTPELLRLRQLLDEARALGEIERGKVNAGSLNATLWEELLALGVVDEQVAKWRTTLERLASARPPVPVGLAATLRDYQRDGLNWLSFLWDNGLGGVLADDMGLGKTVQTLALIARVAEAGAGRFLVVAPASVVTNWAAECQKFTPGFNALAVITTDARSGIGLAERVAGAHIVITSYTLLRIDFQSYAQIDWAGIILDEAQFVKNHNSKTHQCARRLDARFKLAITGTPMENNLMELWSLLSITAPGLFPSPRAFTEFLP